MARTMKVDLPPFTLIGATTRPGLLSQPLHGRFGITLRLDFYDVAALARIVDRSARILSIRIAPEAAREIGARARGTPRIANRLLRRLRDFAEVAGRTRSTWTRRGRRWRASRWTSTASTSSTGGSSRRSSRSSAAARSASGDRRVARRGSRHPRGPLRAVPPPGGLPAAHAARPRRLAGGLPASRNRRAQAGWRALLRRRTEISGRARSEIKLARHPGDHETRPPHLQPDRGPARPARVDERADRPPRNGREAWIRQRADDRPRRRDRDRADVSREGDRPVAVCGGDGTISEAAAGFAGSEVPLGLLPGGRSNVLARELGDSARLRAAEALL